MIKRLLTHGILLTAITLSLSCSGLTPEQVAALIAASNKDKEETSKPKTTEPTPVQTQAPTINNTTTVSPNINPVFNNNPQNTQEQKTTLVEKEKIVFVTPPPSPPSSSTGTARRRAALCGRTAQPLHVLPARGE